MASDIWDRFETMLDLHAPTLLAALNPPASIAEIEAAQATMGVALPSEIRTAYLRHNGSISSTSSRSGDGKLFVPFNWWATLSEMVEDWLFLKDFCKSGREETPEAFSPQPYWDDLRVRPVWGDEKWIPIGLSGTTTRMYVDLNPAPKGVVGQLMIDHGMVDPAWIASSLNHYLEMLIERVERKVLVFGDGWELADPDQSVYGAHGFDWNQLG